MPFEDGIMISRLLKVPSQGRAAMTVIIHRRNIFPHYGILAS
jgi:hypothetical protein